MRWLTGGRVLEPEGSGFVRADIGVEGDRIARIVSSATPAADDEVVELDGRWLLPGLIDCHVHLTQPTDAGDPAAAAGRSDAAVALFTAAAAERTLDAGITTVRDVGGWNYVEMAVREAIESGLVSGPRLFLAGRLLSITTATVSYYPGMYEVADGPDAVREAVRRQLARGADVIKVMATGAMLSSEREDARAIQYTLDELRAAVEIARRQLHTRGRARPRAAWDRARGRGGGGQHRALHVRRRRRPRSARRCRDVRGPDHLRRRAAGARPARARRHARAPAPADGRVQRAPRRHHPTGPPGGRAHRHGHGCRHARQPPRPQRPRVRLHGDGVWVVAGREHPRSHRDGGRARCGGRGSWAAWTSVPARMSSCAQAIRSTTSPS